jgi:hypothetical protein
MAIILAASRQIRHTRALGVRKIGVFLASMSPPFALRDVARGRFIGTVVALTLALGSLLALVPLEIAGTESLGVARSSQQASTYREPAAAARFVNGFATSDAEHIAPTLSPLYRDELLRRGITRRLVFLDRHHLSPPAPEPWLRFTYLGGMADEFGFQHLLYVATSPGDGSTRTVWRLDLTPDDQVIWFEYALILAPAGEQAIAAFTSEADAGRYAALVPRSPVDLGVTPRVATGLRAGASQEFVMLGLFRAGERASERAAVVAFFHRDGDVVRPGWWSYGQPVPTGFDGDPRPTSQPTRLDLAPTWRRIQEQYATARERTYLYSQALWEEQGLSR